MAKIVKKNKKTGLSGKKVTKNHIFIALFSILSPQIMEYEYLFLIETSSLERQPKLKLPFNYKILINHAGA